jgi:DNA polymerase-3 subunit epsilon
MQRHGLKAEVRHRALPDAQLIRQFWQVLEVEHSPERLSTVVEALLAGPVLPAHLDASLIERLPEAPGVFVLHGEDDKILHVAKAGNLKLHLINYFRIDRTSKKALAISHRVKNITWRVTRGAIGAHLQLTALSRYSLPAKQKRAQRGLFSWRLLPEAYPCVELTSLTGRNGDDSQSYGIYDSERKARNALARLAAHKSLCHALLGIRDTADNPCQGCQPQAHCCGARTERLKHLSRAVMALAPLRLAQWPYDGPVGLRERSDLHVIEDWRYLGTAQSEQELHSVLEARQQDFDEETFAYLTKTLGRIPQRRIVRLSRSEERDVDYHLTSD